MGTVQDSERVKLITGVITGFPDLHGQVKERLSHQFGPIDYESGPIPFNYTTYYESEMGPHLIRQFNSFRDLISPEEIVEIKLWTNKLEESYAVSQSYPIARPVNIDPGYLCLSKLVLASTKDYSHRIHLQKGIYAEITLNYKQRAFQSFEWTYPDYKSQPYLDFFSHVRQLYARQL